MPAYHVEALTPDDLDPWHRVVEERLQVGRRQGPESAASEVLAGGADSLGWARARGTTMGQRENGHGRTTMHTMQRTYLDDAARGRLRDPPGRAGASAGALQWFRTPRRVQARARSYGPSG